MLTGTLLLVSLSACGKQTAVMHVYNVKGQYFNRFEAKLDTKRCEITTKDMSRIGADDPSLDGAVMVDRKTYARLLASAKTECINTQMMEQEILQYESIK